MRPLANGHLHAEARGHDHIAGFDPVQTNLRFALRLEAHIRTQQRPAERFQAHFVVDPETTQDRVCHEPADQYAAAAADVRIDPHLDGPLVRHQFVLRRHDHARGPVEVQGARHDRVKRVQGVGEAGCHLSRDQAVEIVRPGEFLTIGDTVVIRIRQVRHRGHTLLVQVVETVAVGVRLRVRAPITVGVLRVRVRARIVLVQVVQTIQVGVAHVAIARVAVVGIETEIDLPPGRHAVTVRVNRIRADRIKVPERHILVSLGEAQRQQIVIEGAAIAVVHVDVREVVGV